MEIWVVFLLGAIMINASKTFMYMSLLGHVFSIPSSIQFEIAVSYGKPAFSPLNSVLDISTPALPFYIPLVVNQSTNFFM